MKQTNAIYILENPIFEYFNQNDPETAQRVFPIIFSRDPTETLYSPYSSIGAITDGGGMERVWPWFSKTPCKQLSQRDPH